MASEVNAMSSIPSAPDRAGCALGFSEGPVRLQEFCRSFAGFGV